MVFGLQLGRWLASFGANPALDAREALPISSLDSFGSAWRSRLGSAWVALSGSIGLGVGKDSEMDSKPITLSACVCERGGDPTSSKRRRWKGQTP